MKKFKNRIMLFLHNVIGHPLMELCYVFGLVRLGNYVHNDLFKIE